jgi:predicted Zn-dependent protease
LATEQPEFIMVSTAQENKLGLSIAKRIEKEYKLVSDPRVQERIAAIGQKIAAVSGRKDITYHFSVLDVDEVNALALPGGYIYVFRGLVDKMPGDDSVAAVLAHEVGHVEAKHPIKKLQSQVGYNFMRILVASSTQDADFVRGSDIAFSQAFLAYSREDELQADRLGIKYMKDAGYNPEAMLSVLKKLREVDLQRPIQQLNFARTHPYIADRQRVVKEELYGKMDFVDYLNKTEP